VCDLGHEGIVGVGVCEHGADGEEDFANSQSRAPLITQNVQADASVGVDVRMIYSRGKVHLWWLERVIGWEMDG